MNSLFVIPDHAAQDIISIFVVFVISFLAEEYSHFFNFSATSCMAFLMTMVLHPQFATQMYSLAELDLSFEYLPRTVVFEIQAHAATRIMRILNFFVPNSGSPFCTQSDINCSDLNFHHEQLVELFVEDVLGDLIHQNRIL